LLIKLSTTSLSSEEVVFVVHLINYLDDGSADTYQNIKIEEKQYLSI